MKTYNLCAFLACAAILCASTASAGLLSVEFTGLNIELAGSTIIDDGPGAATLDPLTSVTYTTDSGSTTVTSPTTTLTADLSIPGVTGIPAAGGLVTSAAGGTLSLGLGGSDHLDISLEEVSVTYLNIGPNIVRLAFGGAVAGVDSQQLPFGLTIGDDVVMSFNTTVSSVTTSGGFVTAFKAAGTGLIDNPVPEPSTAALAMLGVLTACGLKRR